MPWLTHLTLASRDRVRSDRADVSDGPIADCRAMIDTALTQGSAPMPDYVPGYRITATRYGGSLLVTVLGGDDAIATFGIVARQPQGRAVWQELVAAHRALVPSDDPPAQPPAPWCAVVVFPALSDHLDALEWLADFEQVMAWAWLEMPRG